MSVTSDPEMFSTLKVFTKVVLCRAIFANRLFFFDKTKLTLLQARKRWKINVMKGARGFHTNKNSKEKKEKGKRKERSRIRANSKFVAVTRSVCAPFKFKLEKKDTQIVPFIKKSCCR